MKDYNERLKEQFSQLEINIVKHDDSPHGLPCYIEAHLGNNPKDRGQIALDLGNYIYRTFGLAYQMCPEFRGRGKKTTVRWFMSWENVQPILPNIKAAFECKHKHEVLPFEFRSLIIQNPARGVHARTRKVA